MKRSRKGWLTTLAGLCVLAGTVALLYSPTLQYDMFADDFAFYGSKPVGPAFLGYFMHAERPSTSSPTHLYRPLFYRPMADFMWEVYFAVFGENIYLYHAWGVFMHLLNALLVWLCARRLLLLDQKWAIAAALIFSVFWFNFDAVAWISANETALCTIYIMLSLLSSAAYFRNGSPLPLVLLSCTAFLAVFTKGFGIILPALIGVLWLFPFNSNRGSKRIRLFAAISATSSVVAMYMIAECSLGYPIIPGGASIPSTLASTYKLAGLFLGPLEHFFMSLMGLILFLGAVIMKRTRPLAIWVAIGLLPPLSKGAEPRYGYTASVGLALLIAILLEESARAKEGWERIAARAWLGVLAVIAWTELLLVSGDSLPCILLSAAAMLAVLLFVLAKGWIERPKFLSMSIAGLIILANFGNAADFPWVYPIFGEARPLAEKVVPLLPDGGACHNIVFERSLLDGEHRAVPVKVLKPYIHLISGKDVKISDIGEFYESLGSASSPGANEIVLLRQRGDRIERMRAAERPLFEKAESYGTPPPPDLNLDISGADYTESPAFRLCAPPEKGIAWLDFSSSPLNPLVYDLISIGFSNVGDLSSVRVWLEWYPAGSEESACRFCTEVERGHARFELRKNIDWLVAGPIGRLVLRTDDESISLYPTAARIARESLITPDVVQPSVKPIVGFDVLERSGAPREPGDQ